MVIYNGTNGSDTLIDYNRSFNYLDFRLVTINGFDGDDVIIGQDTFSNYILFGGAGNDFIVGGFYSNVLIGDDTFDGVGGNDILAGRDGTDSLYGCGGNDTLYGYGGNDELIGGPGTDNLTGGAGNDAFQYFSVSDSKLGLSRDIIKDFVGNGNLLGDTIDLSNIDANTTIGGDQAFTYIGSRAFTAAGQIRYSGGILQGNTDSNLAANFEIKLEGSLLLVASDIIA
ncbi:hemolysin-type calcium-binding region [Nostoc linckia NIES-25]|nr:hemolysin-type calcium-binding region [Nostoc linckia NIES-25]